MLDGIIDPICQSGQTLNMTIEKPATLHELILSEVRDKIMSGAWLPGYRIPFETEMAVSYGVSRMTVNKVLTQLSREGYLERRRKGGTVVARPRGQSAVMMISDIGEEVRASGATYAFELVKSGIRMSDADVGSLLHGLPIGKDILDIEYIHIADGVPFCHEWRLINLDAAPEARTTDFATEQAGAWLLKQIPWSSAEHVIRAVSPAQNVAKQLQIAPSTPCLEIERRTEFEDRPVTFVCLTYPGSAHQLVARFSH